MQGAVVTLSCALERPPDGTMSSKPAPSLRNSPCRALHDHSKVLVSHIIRCLHQTQNNQSIYSLVKDPQEKLPESHTCLRFQSSSQRCPGRSCPAAITIVKQMR